MAGRRGGFGGPAGGRVTLDFLVYLHLLARYGWSRQQVDAMPPERIAVLLSLEDGESK
jgi:hypothetical protein